MDGQLTLFWGYIPRVGGSIESDSELDIMKGDVAEIGFATTCW